jgi:hypothetical protein
VELGFGALCLVFALALVLGILRKELLTFFRVLFKPVEKLFCPSYVPMDPTSLWSLVRLGFLIIGSTAGRVSSGSLAR